MKTCSRCGKELPVDNFRSYYNRPGTYTYCLECERIENRRKYLKRLGDAATEKQQHELEAIEELYKRRGAAGLNVPGKTRSKANKSVCDLVDELLSKYEKES